MIGVHICLQNQVNKSNDRKKTACNVFVASKVKKYWLYRLYHHEKGKAKSKGHKQQIGTKHKKVDTLKLADSKRKLNILRTFDEIMWNCNVKIWCFKVTTTRCVNIYCVLQDYEDGNKNGEGNWHKFKDAYKEQECKLESWWKEGRKKLKKKITRQNLKE